MPASSIFHPCGTNAPNITSPAIGRTLPPSRRPAADLACPVVGYRGLGRTSAIALAALALTLTLTLATTPAGADQDQAIDAPAATPAQTVTALVDRVAHANAQV